MSKWIMVAMTAMYVGSAALAADATWAEKTKVKGDVRYRHEYIDDARKSDTRTRQRVRARAGIFADVNETLKAGIQVCSGGSDPVSSNQTLDDSFSSKGVNLDLAYFDWSLVEGLNVTGGKMKKPFITVADLVWDGDLNPEGLAISGSIGGDTKLLANAGYLWLDENGSSDSDDRMLYTGQVAVESKMGCVSLLAGVGVYSYDNMQGYAPLVDDASGFGNSLVETVDAAGDSTFTYANDFMEVEAFVQVGFKAAGVPMKVMGQYVQNEDADSDNAGFLAGVKAGKASAPGSFEVGYNYRSLEKDAVVGALCDSDFNGGGTNGEGHKLSGKVAIAKNWSFGAAYFMNSKDPDGKNTDYDRAQFDLACKF
jgi:hypothetical protein